MSALKFRVLLDTEKDTEIFRDILISEDADFETFYTAIINAFRFEGNQMASFYVSNENWDKGHEISLMDMSYGDEASEEIVSNMADSRLADFIEAADQKFILVYDFMRMWIFLIELIERTGEEVSEPVVAMSVGMAPPEDSKMMDLNDEEEEGFDLDEEDDDIFGSEFEDGYDDDDYSGYNEYDY